MEKSDLCVPIYLNQKIVFDVLAMLEDGFSQLSTQRTMITESDNRASNVGANIGASNVFAFLGISFKGETGRNKGAENQQEATAEKVHTPAFLFSKLRSTLAANEFVNVIQNQQDLKELSSGDFVEFKAVLRKNPLIEAIETFKKLLNIATLFSDEASSSSQTKQQGNKQRNKNATRKQDSPDGIQVFSEQLSALETTLNSSNSLEIIGEIIEAESLRAVLSTSIDFFNDGDSAEIIDGEFRVLGKVVRVLEDESGGSINLLRKTDFGGLDTGIFDELGEVFSGAKEAGVVLPEFEIEIEGPAIQVIPIAIFV